MTAAIITERSHIVKVGWNNLHVFASKSVFVLWSVILFFTVMSSSAQAPQPGFDQALIGNVDGRTRAFGVAVADFTNDNIDDIISGDTFGDVHLYIGDGTGGFLNDGVKINQFFHDAYALTAGNFDANPNNDFILVRTGGAGSTGEGELHLYSGNGDGTFVATGFPQQGTVIGIAGTDAISLASGDIDGDGDVDVISGERIAAAGDTADIVLWRNQAAQGSPLLFLREVIIQGLGGSPVPEQPPYFPPNAYLHAYGLAIGDVTGDGLNDLLVGDKAHYLYVYKNIGGGVFEPIRYDTISTRPFAFNRLHLSFNEGMSLAIADFNADGWVDVIAGNTGAGGGAVSVWINEGLDELGRPVFTGAGIVGSADTESRGLATGQFNITEDNFPDAVFGTFAGNLYALFTDLVDTDGDGIIDDLDNAPLHPNAARIDMNTDGGINYLDQLDNDNDGIGDPADDDDDNDSVPDLADNCPFTPNLDQQDRDSDGWGDGCDALNNNDLDGDGITDGPLEQALWIKAMQAKARWSRSDTHFIIRIDALSRVFQNEFVQTFVDAAILKPEEWEMKKFENYNGIGDEPAVPGYNVPADLDGGMDSPVTVATIPKEIWNAFGDPDPVRWINDRNVNSNLEISQHGTYHANNTPLGDWATLNDRNFFSSESAGLTVAENFQLLRVGQRTLLGLYELDQWLQDSGADPAISPKIDWSLAANPLISYAPPFNTSDAISRSATARLGYRGFSASITEEEGVLAPFFSPEGSHHEQFDQFGMFHASADRQVDPEAPAGMDYLDWLMSITEFGGLNTWLIEEVEWSTRYCNSQERLTACAVAPGGINRENNMVDPERWAKWLTLLDYVNGAGEVMTQGDYALAQQFDNAPTVPNPDQGDANHNGIGDVIDGAVMSVEDVFVECPAANTITSLVAHLTNDGVGIDSQLITIFFDAEGGGEADSLEAVTNTDGRATVDVNITGNVGDTFEYTAFWDGWVATADGEGRIQVVDTTPPVFTDVSVSPTVLSPPNHKLITVSVTAIAADACDPSPQCRITQILSNEPENGLGDGDASPDIIVTGDLSVKLRKERSGTGEGRIYTLVVECTDDSGNTVNKELIVTVPHDNRGRGGI